MPYKTYDQQRQYQAIWMWRRRLTWILENGPCSQCAGTKDLQVVYKDPSEKVVRVTSIWSRSDEVREELLAKCVVLCKDCSLSKRREERQPEHGANGRYDQGCRCDACKAAHAVHNRKYRRRPRQQPKVLHREMDAGHRVASPVGHLPYTGQG